MIACAVLAYDFRGDGALAFVSIIPLQLCAASVLLSDSWDPQLRKRRLTTSTLAVAVAFGVVAYLSHNRNFTIADASPRAHSLALRDLRWHTGEISTRRFMVLLFAFARVFRNLVFYHDNTPGISLLLRSSIRPLYHLS